VGTLEKGATLAMKALPLLLLAIALSSQPAYAEDSVILGRALSHKYIENVETVCPPEYMCVSAWYRWALNAHTTLRGPELSGRVIAARSQHTGFVRSYEKSLRLFVLRPIDDEEQRRLLRADYYILDMSAPREMYCLDNETNQLGIAAEDKFTAPGARDRYCFELPKDDESG